MAREAEHRLEHGVGLTRRARWPRWKQRAFPAQRNDGNSAQTRAVSCRPRNERISETGGDEREDAGNYGARVTRRGSVPIARKAENCIPAEAGWR